ncbi:MAG: WG repeat-containing protein [Saprospiraceae bacterium]
MKGFYRVTGFGGFEGLVNEARDTVVAPIYHLGTPHPNGYIIATFDKKKWGVIDTKNNTLYPFTADKLGDWTDSGLLPVRADKQMGVLKFPDAEEVIPFGKYEDIKVYDAQKDIFLVTQNKLKALVNAEEETILPFDYTFISQADHYVHQLHHKDGQKGFWNDKNGFISEYQYDRIHNLKDSLIIVEKDGTWALLDAKNGQEVIPFSDFFIEKKGDYFISHKKYDFQMSSTVKGHLNGLYDRSGQVVLPHDSVDIVVFPDQTFWVQPQAKSSKMECEHRTRHGEVLRRLPKIGVEVISGNSWIFNSKNPEGKYQATFFSYLDPPGKENYFQRIDSPSENLLLVKQGKLYGYADKEGRVIIPPAFEAAEKSSKGLLKVKYKGKWGVLKNPMFDYLK